MGDVDPFVGSWGSGPWKSTVGVLVMGWAYRLARVVGPYPVVVLTLLIGAGSVVALTATSAEIYEAVAEEDGVASLDQPALRIAVRLRGPAVNALVTAYTDLGGPVGMSILATLATTALAVWARRWTPVVLMAAATAGSLLMTVVGKGLVGRIRPPLAEAVPPYESSPAFPSGHALNAVVVMGVLAYLLVLRQRHWRSRALTIAAAGAFAVTMGLSRVLLGHHWLTDVLMAWTLGLAWLAVVVVAHRLYLAIRHIGTSRVPGVG